MVVLAVESSMAEYLEVENGRESRHRARMYMVGSPVSKRTLLLNVP